MYHISFLNNAKLHAEYPKCHDKHVKSRLSNIYANQKVDISSMYSQIVNMKSLFQVFNANIQSTYHDKYNHKHGI